MVRNAVLNAVLSGRFYRLLDGTMLPVGMRFGVEGLVAVTNS